VGGKLAIGFGVAYCSIHSIADSATKG